MSHYETLGVDKDASTADVKAAYRRAAQKAHPDKNPDNPNAAEEFARVNTAYQTLVNPSRRALYDETGDDGAGPKIDPEIQAHQTAAEIVLSLAEKAGDYDNLIAVARLVVERTRENEKQKVTEEQKQIIKLEKFLKRLKRRRGAKGVALIIITMERKIARRRASVERLRQSIADHEPVLKILDTYTYADFKPDDDVPQAFLIRGHSAA